MEKFIPWPVWEIILNYTKDWKLRAVCKRFSIIIYKNFKFKYSDLKAIIKFGYANIIVKYFEQHNYREYNVESRAISINNFGVAQELFKRGIYTSDKDILFKSGSFDILRLYSVNLDQISIDAAYNAGKSGCKPLIEFILKKYSGYRSTIVAGAIKCGHFNIARLIDPHYPIINLAKINESLKVLKIEILFNEACAAGNLTAVEYLLSKWDPSNKILDGGYRKACLNGKLEVAMYLYNLVEITNIQAEHQYANFIAMKGRLNIVKFFYKMGLRLDSLASPVETGKLDVVKFLVSENVPITKNDVAIACEFNQYHISEYFMECGIKKCNFCKNYARALLQCPISQRGQVLYFKTSVLKG